MITVLRNSVILVAPARGDSMGGNRVTRRDQTVTKPRQSVLNRDNPRLECDNCDRS
jgi:hypothetical protein